MGKQNLTLMTDLYELTMMQGYFRNKDRNETVIFDAFYRNNPMDSGYSICAGLEQVIDYVNNLHFEDDDIAYLRSKGIFDEGFLNYLKNFKFHGDIYAVPEGTPVFPGEPLLTVRAPAIEAQLIETYLLLEINHQSLIATKANRIVRAAQGRAVLEFGSRRAQGADGAVIGARAAYIGGVAGTACTLTDVLYGVPAGGTMAHSWVQMFPTEYDAFKTYCELYPDNATLLVDTYNTLKSGVPNAIRAFKEILLPRGITNFAIRLDSGDISYLSKKARKMLDEAGWALGSDGVRMKDGVPAAFDLYYSASDSVRQAIAMEFANQMGELGIKVSPKGASWDDIYRHQFSDPVVWGWGSNSPIEIYNLNYSTGNGNYACYENEAVDAHLNAALANPVIADSYNEWKLAMWDGENGVAPQGAATWGWFANVDHLYFVADGLKVADQKPHPHGHGWSIVNNVDKWSW